MPADPHPNALNARRERLDDMTPAQAFGAGYKLFILCTGCRSIKPADLGSVASRHPDQPIRTIIFRCRATRPGGDRCRSVGQPEVTGWQGGGRVIWS